MISRPPLNLMRLVDLIKRGNVPAGNGYLTTHKVILSRNTHAADTLNSINKLSNFIYIDREGREWSTVIQTSV